MSTTVDSASHINRTAAFVARSERQLTIALAGNPNAGKTTLFNKLTGLRQKVANYSGVTVERKEGVWPLAASGPPARLVDLPGLYSLDAAAVDEQIARDVLLGRINGVSAPDVIVAVVDATNLERNLYLVTQLLEYGRPLVVALTMVDLAAARQIEIDTKCLSDELGVPVVPVIASQRHGTAMLAAAVLKAASTTKGPGAGWHLTEYAERELAQLSEKIIPEEAGLLPARYAALHDLYGQELPVETTRRRAVSDARERLANADPKWWQEPLLARYEWIGHVAAKALAVRRDGTAVKQRNVTAAIDRVVTHKVFGLAILVLLTLLVFQTIFWWANAPMELIDKGFSVLGETVRSVLPPGLLADLIVDGILAGVGGVLVFLPQILLLFFFIAILEDSGYMARAAFLMDRLMRSVGLHGKAFMPLLSSFACAIPGIMATRTIENPRDRIATMMIAPFMSCSARLPVYSLMIGALFAEQKLFGFVSVGALVIMAMYVFGIGVAIGVAWILKRTMLKGPTPPLIMELPPYRVPLPFTVAQTLWSRAWLFLRRAGTVILAISIVLWALVTFPRSQQVSISGDGAQHVVAQATRETGTEATGPTAPAVTDNSASDEAAGEQLRQSFAGRAGRAIEPLIAPLGFDWKIGIALITSFAARETFVSTLGIVYNVDAGTSEEAPLPVDAVRNAKWPDGAPVWTPLVAVSMLVFIVLACQCMSTVAIVRRETNSWRWPLFMVGYMLVLAYVASLITYQGGRLLGFS